LDEDEDASADHLGDLQQWLNAMLPQPCGLISNNNCVVFLPIDDVLTKINCMQICVVVWL
jgi:hypothetical protein